MPVEDFLRGAGPPSPAPLRLTAAIDRDAGVLALSLPPDLGRVLAHYGRDWHLGALLAAQGASYAGLARHFQEDEEASGVTLGYLHGLEVTPDRRGEGLGSLLVETALGALRGLGIARVFLHARPDEPRKLGALLAFYGRHGFEQFPVRDHDPVLYRAFDGWMP